MQKYLVKYCKQHIKIIIKTKNILLIIKIIKSTLHLCRVLFLLFANLYFADFGIMSKSIDYIL